MKTFILLLVLSVPAIAQKKTSSYVNGKLSSQIEQVDSRRHRMMIEKHPVGGRLRFLHLRTPVTSKLVAAIKKVKGVESVEWAGCRYCLLFEIAPLFDAGIVESAVFDATRPFVENIQ